MKYDGFFFTDHNKFYSNFSATCYNPARYIVVLDVPHHGRSTPFPFFQQLPQINLFCTSAYYIYVFLRLRSLKVQWRIKGHFNFELTTDQYHIARSMRLHFQVFSLYTQYVLFMIDIIVYIFFWILNVNLGVFSLGVKCYFVCIQIGFQILFCIKFNYVN